MNAVINTKNTTYTLRDGNKLGTSYISGGRFHDIEIDTPNVKDLILGKPFAFMVTNSQQNAETFRNQIVTTSPISSIELHPERDVKYMFNTKNSTYQLSQVPDNPKVMRITSNEYSNLEIYTPKDTPQIGESLHFVFTNNPANGDYAGRIMHTSSVQSKSQYINIQAPLNNQQQHRNKLFHHIKIIIM
jgi:hypothetical protein